MSSIAGERELELLKAHTRVSKRTFDFVNSMSLKCAIELGVADAIHGHGKPMTLPELVAAMPIHSNKTQYLFRVMRLLLHAGIFAVEKVGEQEGYILTDESRLLLKDSPFDMSSLVVFTLDPMLMVPWQNMASWFKSDDASPFTHVRGMPMYDYLAHDLPNSKLFNEAMATDSAALAGTVTTKCREVFEGLNSLVDVAGGTGAMAKAIAEAFPQMQCTVLDLPYVVAGLEDSKNLKFVGGNMFEKIPKADAVMLKWILHDWNDGHGIKILKSSKEAIAGAGKRGKVIIIDMVHGNDDDPESTETRLFYDIVAVVCLNGRLKTEKEWAKMFTAAGFSGYKIMPVLGARSLIEVYV